MKTVDQLVEQLKQMQVDGHGAYRVLFQEVVHGVTFGSEIGVSIGDPADGKVMWVWKRERDYGG